MRILALVLTMWTLQSFAVTRAPLVLRACLNNTDSTVTLSWNPMPDICGSFSKYVIYGNENAGPYNMIAEIPILATSQHSFSLPDLNNSRNYYITVLHLCDGVDSAVSNIVPVDIVKPPAMDLIKVSFDINTQHIIATWNSNSAPDTKGYRIYKHNSGINDSIGETTDTSFTVSTDPNNVFSVTYATYDSCRLFSPISTPHRPAQLAAVIDTCAREIQLNWSRYSGWAAIDSQALFLSTNGGSFTHYNSFNGADNSFLFSNLTLGDTFCFVLKSYTGSQVIESNSNKVCIETRAFVLPTFLYLDYITVLDDQSIELNWTTDETWDISSFEINRAIDQGTLNSVQTLALPNKSGNYTWNDVGVATDLSVYSYKLVAYNHCAEAIANSQESNSILLTLDGDFSFNAYSNWDGAVEEYDIQFRPTSSSTWNVEATQADAGSFVPQDSVFCYRIEARENPNSYGKNALSHSNTVCIEPELQVFAPNTFVIGGTNNRFVVKGSGIDHSNSTYEIYNRWGELIARNATNEPWYGTYLGENVLPGIYVYVIRVQGVKGEKEMVKGVLRIIQ